MGLSFFSAAAFRKCHAYAARKIWYNFPGKISVYPALTGVGGVVMQEKEHSLSKWFGERKIVRLMLLAALLALAIIHVEFLLGTVQFLIHVTQPLILGASIAYILDIVIRSLDRILFPNAKSAWLIKSRRSICICLAFILVISMIVLMIFTVIPGLTEAFTLLGKEAPNYFTQCKEWVLDVFKDVPVVREPLENMNLEWNSMQDRIVNWALNGSGRSTLISSTVSIIGTVTGEIASFFISCIFAVFLLAGKSQLTRQYHSVMHALFSEKVNDRLEHVLSTANRCFSGFIVGQSLNGLILGILTWLGMRIFGMPYALMVGVLSGTTSLIPIIGGYIGAILGTFLVFTVSPSLALWFLLFIVALQTIQGNALYPRLVGNSVGIPSLWVLAAVSVGGGIGGIGGMVMAVPITATLYALLHDWVQKRNREKAALQQAQAKT